MTRIDWLEKHLVEAEQMFYENKVEEGLERLNNLLYEEPGYGSLHNHLGWAYLYYSSNMERAELHLKLAVRFAESFPAPYLHLGALYIRLGRYSDAIYWLQLGLTRHQPNRIAFLQNMAQGYELQGKWREAIKAYKEAMMNTVVEHEVTNLAAGIKRCRKKRWTMLLKV